MAKASTAASADPRFELVPLSRLVESPANHRKKTWGAMDELIESVRAKGVLQPILARPVKGIGSNLLEIVFGHRRFRAAQEAGLETIPAVVRELSDVDALEANVIENLQRADVHPLEEAEGYEQLLQQTDRPYTVEDIAAKVGKSRGYVYGRMKLLALCPAARAAFYEGKLTASVALLIARIPSPELQKKALDELTRYGDPGEPVRFSHAVDVIQREFMLELGRAPFDRGDAELVPGAGPCTTCPKRTGNQPELFGDVKSADVCTDPACFQVKTGAGWERRKAEFEAAGRKVLSAKETKTVFYDHANTTKHDADYVALDATCSKDPKSRSYKKLLGKHAKEAVVLARAPGGDVVELVPKAELNKLLKKAGVDFKAEREATKYGGPRASPEEARAAKEEAEIRSETKRRVRALILEKLRTTGPDREFWLLAVHEHQVMDEGDILADRWPRESKESPLAYDKRLARELEKLSDAELRGLALGFAVSVALEGYSDGAGRLRAWAGVDEKKVLGEVRAARKVASLATAALVIWEADPKRKGIWIGKGGGRVYQVEVDRPNGKGFSIKTLKPGGAQVGSWGQASPTGGLEEAKARCEEDARAAAPAKKGGRRG
jgi:ParB/RepB/Spo0J family partition protein